MFVIAAVYLPGVHESVQVVNKIRYQLLAHYSLDGSGSDEVSLLDLLCERPSCLHSLEHNAFNSPDI